MICQYASTRITHAFVYRSTCGTESGSVYLLLRFPVSTRKSNFQDKQSVSVFKHIFISCLTISEEVFILHDPDRLAVDPSVRTAIRIWSFMPL